MSLRSLSRLFVVFIGIFSAHTVAADEPQPAHGIAMHGDLKYGPDFKHFDYVNPDAPKGGEVRQWAFGGFDSLNAFILKGNPGAGTHLIYDTLLKSSDDEPFS